MANVETRRDEYTFLGSGCNIRTHLLRAAARPRVYFIEIWARGGSREERTVRMRPGGKSNGESPFFETPNLSFEGRVGILAPRTGVRLRTSVRAVPVVRESSCGGERSSVWRCRVASHLPVTSRTYNIRRLIKVRRDNHDVQFGELGTDALRFSHPAPAPSPAPMYTCLAALPGR